MFPLKTLARKGLKLGSGTPFTNDFSITIQIKLKFYLAVIQLLVIISHYAMTAQLSCHVWNFVRIALEFEQEQYEISFIFELWWKNC